MSPKKPVFTLMLLCLLAPVAGAAQYETLTGRLSVIWGDPHAADHDAPAVLVVSVADESGKTTELSISPELAARHGGFVNWNGRLVEARVYPGDDFEGRRPGTRRLAALTLLPEPGAEVLGGVTGSQPWVSLLCKFSDIVAEPQNLAYFEDMYANTVGGLDHYWRENSYDQIDVVGSTAIDWLDLPGTHVSYVPVPGSGTTADLGQLFEDCTAAADPFVDFSDSGSGPFVGINMMFNDLLDCCAWGGGRFATLDGVSKVWRTTWNPPWAFSNAGVIAHEMGHGMGLPHANNSDEDGNPYDSPWDVMSAATSNSIAVAPYGAQGKHHTAYHKNRLGWFAPAEVLEVSLGTQVTATIDAMALATTPNYRMARVPILGTDDWYTVETRDFLGYDGALPGNAVIITHVDEGRSEPAWVQDADDPPATFSNNPGTMFLPGETFEGTYVTVSVDFATTDGFEVTITSSGSGIFADGFESGDVAVWSSSVP